MSKEHVCERIWYAQKYRYQIPATDLDSDKIVKGKYNMFKNKGIKSSFITSQMSAMEKTSTFHIRVLKYNEDIYKNKL